MTLICRLLLRNTRNLCTIRLCSASRNTQSRSLSIIPTRKMASVAEYGTWKSPISSRLATESSVVFQQVEVDQAEGHQGTVYWSELRFDEGGRCVVCSSKDGQKDISAWTPKDFNARTRVHEYGGGSFMVHAGKVYFTNFADQKLYVQNSPDDKPVALAPDEGNAHRFADMNFCTKIQKIYCVREDHTLVEEKKAKEPVNTVVCIDVATKKQTVMASGCDFYSSPRVSLDGSKIAWVQWNHPNMPWDSTEIWTCDLNESGDGIKEGTAVKVAGGEGTSVMFPRWLEGGDLLYIGDQTDWWNLYLVKPGGGEHENLYKINKELGGPHWIFGNYPIGVNKGFGKKVITTFGELGVLDADSKEYKKIETGFAKHSFINLTAGGAVFCSAASSTQFPAVVKINVNDGKVDTIKESRSLSVDQGYLSIPKEISWTTEGGKKSYGNLYLPQNKDFKAPEGSLPPLLVKVHGGPTAQCSNALDLKMQYFTSRGFAVLDVNYRGSTGYGKAYRNELRNNWGIHDVDDCCTGALYLAETGQVDPKRLCIDGGSAGGYTTLACLAFKDVFKAGASHYGVADVEALVLDTHKFESRYIDNLVAPYNENTKVIYAERSPINHIDNFKCPIAFFQGDEDKIVLPNQAEMMYKAVKEKGLTTVYELFQGEQHGFRKAENIQRALDGEFYFFGKVFGFEPADQHCKLNIDNLK